MIRIVNIVVIFSLIVLFFVFGGDSDNPDEFDTIVSEFSYIDSVYFRGNSPSLFIGFEIEEGTTSEDVDLVFERTRDIFLEQETFDNLMSFHKERYGGTVMSMYIIFTSEGNGYYTYYSESETGGEPSVNSFSNWIVDRNGKKQHYKK